MASIKELIPDWAVGTFWIGLAALFLGVVAVVAGPDTLRFTAEAGGVVSRVEKHGKTYVSYVRFKDSDHVEVEAKAEVNGPVRRHHEGDGVTVFYDPRNPGSGCLILGDEDLVGAWRVMAWLLPLGGAALLAAAAGTVYACFVKPRRVP